jgi:hypothetical protein
MLGIWGFSGVWFLEFGVLSPSLLSSGVAKAALAA